MPRDHPNGKTEMPIRQWMKQAGELGAATWNKSAEMLGAGTGYLKSSLGNTWLLGSTAASSDYDHQKFDERHYFLIPFHLAEAHYSLHVTRLLPDGVPPINDLPKQRFVHLPNDHAMPAFEAIVTSQARQTVESAEPSSGSLAGRLNELADQLDRLEGKMFGGVLLVGGLVALVNPAAGAVVAAKAALPSIGLFLSKYGLKYAGDSVQEKDVARQVKNAEKEVLQQFRNTEAQPLTNPLLSQLDLALRTHESQYEPILDFEPGDLSFGDQDRSRMLKVTAQAITNTYAELLEQPKQWPAARLGPEDIRYLRLLAELAEGLR